MRSAQRASERPRRSPLMTREPPRPASGLHQACIRPASGRALRRGGGGAEPRVEPCRREGGCLSMCCGALVCAYTCAVARMSRTRSRRTWYAARGVWAHACELAGVDLNAHTRACSRTRLLTRVCGQYAGSRIRLGTCARKHVMCWRARAHVHACVQEHHLPLSLMQSAALLLVR